MTAEKITLTEDEVKDAVNLAYYCKDQEEYVDRLGEFISKTRRRHGLDAWEKPDRPRRRVTALEEQQVLSEGIFEMIANTEILKENLKESCPSLSVGYRIVAMLGTQLEYLMKLVYKHTWSDSSLTGAEAEAIDELYARYMPQRYLGMISESAVRRKSNK